MPEIMVAALRLMKRLCLALVLFGSSKAFVISAGLLVTMLACAEPVAAQKPHPAGIIDLPGPLGVTNPIGDINARPWLNVNVDGMRCRMGWDGPRRGLWAAVLSRTE